MINWEYYTIKIDRSARLQFDHYFADIKLILDSQNLSLKEHEIFKDLEDHIIDYIKNKNITTISFKEAMEIITELGPPEEFTDFSNLPGLVDEINRGKTRRLTSNNAFVDNQFNEPILCDNCNAKNEKNSVYCIQCGVPLKKKPVITSNRVRNPFSYVLHTNPEYFFSILTYFMLELFALMNILLSQQPYSDSGPYIGVVTFVVIALITNEFIVVPGIFLYRILKSNFTRKELGLFLTTYLLKISTIITLLAIGPIFGSFTSMWSGVIFITVIIISYPIILTKLLFFTDYSLSVNFNRPVNSVSKIGYIISAIILMFSAFVVYLSPDNLGIETIFILFFFVFGLFASLDFLLSFLLFKGKIIIKDENSNIGGGISYGKDIPKKISVLSDKIQIGLLFCNIGLILLFIESVYLNTLQSMFGVFVALFSIFIFAFVLVDFYYDYYHNKSSNILLFALGIYYLDFSIMYSSFEITSPFAFLNGTRALACCRPPPSLFNSGLSIPLILFILISGVFFPVLAVLILRNKTINDINVLSTSNNKITNIILAFCYFILIILVVVAFNSSIYLAGFTSLFGLSVLLFVKPFLNFLSYFMMHKFNIHNHPSKLVHQ